MGKEQGTKGVGDLISAQQQEDGRKAKLASETRGREIKRLQESIKSRVDFLNKERCAFLAPYAAVFKRTGVALLLEELKKEVLERERRLCDTIFVGVGGEIEYFWSDPYRRDGEKKTHSSGIVHFSGENFSGNIEGEVIRDSLSGGVSVENLILIKKRVDLIDSQGKYGFRFLEARASLSWQTFHTEIWGPNLKQIMTMDSPLAITPNFVRFGMWHYTTTMERIPDPKMNIVFSLAEDEGSLFRGKKLQLELRYYLEGKDQIYGERSFQVPERQWGDKEKIRKLIAEAYVELSPKKQ